MGAGASIGTSAGLSIGNAFTGVLGSISKAKAQKDQAEYEAKQMEFNAQIAELQVKDVNRQAKEQVVEVRKLAKRITGAERAAYAGQNVVVDSGSAADIQRDTAIESALDVVKIKNNAWRSTFGYKVEAIDLYAKAKFARIAGAASARNTILTGGLQAFQGLLKAGTSLAGGFGGGGGSSNSSSSGGGSQGGTSDIFSEAPQMV